MPLNGRRRTRVASGVGLAVLALALVAVGAGVVRAARSGDDDVASAPATHTEQAEPTGRSAPPEPTPPPEPTESATPIAQPGSAEQAWEPLVPGTSWQWQIDGEPIDTTVLDAVDNPRKMFDVDMESTDAATIARLHDKGIVVVCYLETGGWESYRADAGAYPASVLGNAVDGYPEERWVDIRQIDVLAPIIAARLDDAAAKGCDGIEPDLDDSYTANTGFPITMADQIAFNTATIELAHDRGMSMGLKNGPDIAEQMAPIADWALTESCNLYDECAGYAAFVALGKAVFDAEYTAEGMTLDDFCPADAAAGFDGLLKESSETLHAYPWAACPGG